MNSPLIQIVHHMKRVGGEAQKLEMANALTYPETCSQALFHYELLGSP